MNKFQKGGRRNDRDDRQEMHKATCAECGNGCEVPFRPNGKRPVLCSKCYTEAGGHGYDSDRADKPRREDRYAAPRPRTEALAIPAALEVQLKEINEKLDVLIEVLTMDESELDEEDYENMEEIDEEAA